MDEKGSGYAFPIKRQKKPKNERFLRYCIGIDPGYTENGVILRVMGEKRITAWWVGCAPPRADRTDLGRAVSLADATVYQIRNWIEKYNIEYLDICIETPFIRGLRDQSIMKMTRLVQEIESEILSFVSPMLTECWVTEVAPKESKVLATGSGTASKEYVYREFPKFKRTKFPTNDTKYTVSDAWAHSLAAWEKGGTRTKYDAEMMIDIVELSKGTSR